MSLTIDYVSLFAWEGDIACVENCNVVDVPDNQ